MKTSKQMKKAIKDGRIHATKGRRPVNLDKQEKWARGDVFVKRFWARIGVYVGA